MKRELKVFFWRAASLAFASVSEGVPMKRELKVLISCVITGPVAKFQKVSR